MIIGKIRKTPDGYELYGKTYEDIFQARAVLTEQAAFLKKSRKRRQKCTRTSKSSLSSFSARSAETR